MTRGSVLRRDGGRPQNALSGTLFTVNCCTSAIKVLAEFGQMRFWRGTSIASMAPGQVATLPDGTLGYEWDSDTDNGFRPTGLLRLSQTTVDAPQRLLDFGSTYGQAIADHSLTLYRHASGALVFGAGTVQWSWGLDKHHDRGTTDPDPRMQQATVNLFADMGIQPLSLTAGLTPATASSDTLAPSSTITFPAPDSHAQPNTDVTISGLATDLGGGQVAAVEVSLDGGTTWQRATGQANWSFSWHTGLPGTATILSRAVDDSGNLEVPGTGVTFTISNYEVTAPGGPILVVTSAANPFTSYYAEILRTEGLNAFGLLDISQLDSTTLVQYHVVILGEMALTEPQVTMLADWVSTGGNLIAMRPDASWHLCSDWPTSAPRSRMPTCKSTPSVAPGAGHRRSDDAVPWRRESIHACRGDGRGCAVSPTRTLRPRIRAVTIRNVGTAGGQAAAFTYDLARSVVYTRQGNPAWSGQERDGQASHSFR